MAQIKHSIRYNDPLAGTYPDPVEPIKLDKFKISGATVDTRDKIAFSQLGLFTIHAVVRRSLRCVARQARIVEPSQRAHFLEYAKFTFKTLDSHHHHEEELWFPTMKPYIDFSESSHEHGEIERLLNQNIGHIGIAEAHLRGGAAAPKWPGEDMSETTEALLEVLLPHLEKEESLACLYGRRCPAEVYQEFERKIEAMAMSEARRDGMIWAMSFQMRHWSKGEKEVWPPAPHLVKAGIQFLGSLFYGKYLEFGPTEEELQN